MAQTKFGSGAKSRRKRDRKKVEIRKKEFQYQGKTLEDLQKLSIEELLPLLTSRSRRTLKRGLSKDENKLMNDIKNAKEGDLIRTHCRNMIVLPSFVWL
jgi:small subunit ribosomal protein S19